MKSKKAQIWVETVMYSLIMLTIIGIVLGVARPAIQQKQDRVLIEQSIEMLNDINKNVEDVVFYGPPNSRYNEISIKKGVLKINGINDTLEFYIESKYKYSEIGEEVSIGNVKALTSKKADSYEVELKIIYDGINITFDRKDEIKTLNPSPTPYRVYVRNEGEEDGKSVINFYFA